MYIRTLSALLSSSSTPSEPTATGTSDVCTPNKYELKLQTHSMQMLYKYTSLCMMCKTKIRIFAVLSKIQSVASPLKALSTPLLSLYIWVFSITPPKQPLFQLNGSLWALCTRNIMDVFRKRLRSGLPMLYLTKSDYSCFSNVDSFHSIYFQKTRRPVIDSRSMTIP